MTYMIKLSSSALALAAGVVMLGSTGSVPAAAKTIYYGETVSFREAKRMCDGIHGRTFLSSRDVYACHNDPARAPKKYVPPSTVPQPASAPAKRQNFAGSKEFPGLIGGHGGGNGGNGGGGNGGSGGSAGGPN